MRVCCCLVFAIIVLFGFIVLCCLRLTVCYFCLNRLIVVSLVVLLLNACLCGFLLYLFVGVDMVMHLLFRMRCLVAVLMFVC